MNFLSFGETLWDIIEGQEFIGGAPFNVAAHLARCGAHACMLSRLGCDQRGDKTLAVIQDLGVDTRLMQSDMEHPTGTVRVLLENGQPSYTITENAAWDFVECDDKVLEEVQAGDFTALCFGTLSQRNEVSRATLRKLFPLFSGRQIFYDVNLRQDFYSKEIIMDSLHAATILKVNADEVRTLSQMLYGQEMYGEDFAAAAARDYQLQVVIITMGENGSAVWHDDWCDICPTARVSVADAVGAGDAFSAAFLLEYCRGKSPLEAVRTANALGGYVASQHGAIPEYSLEIKKILGIVP